ncbi:MAG: hypothetical protein LBV19_10920 [Streptococcaceae bacterium]|jgi:hypothetical protein|nr:hypothetical protein [Streptococcaceae bacterium]
MICDCSEREGVEINSYQLFLDLKAFFEGQTAKGIFEDIPVETPSYVGYSELSGPMEWYAEKWYRCKSCGTLWEFQYPDFPAKGEVRKFSDGVYQPEC